MYAVSLDPGGTTGVCLTPSADSPWLIEVLQLGPEDHHAQLLRSLTLWKPEIIICERFQNRGKDAVVLASGEYIGVAKAYSQTAKVPLVMQTSSMMTFWNDDRLRNHGLYVRGLPHGRDACRHYLYYRTFTCKDSSILVNRDGCARALGIDSRIRDRMT